MLDMIKGAWVSRALYVAAKLGIPDLLREGRKSSDDLARATGTHAPSLYRVLRALDSVGVFADRSLRYFAIEELGENHYPAWEPVLHSVETGAIAFDHFYGMSKWQYMAEHPDEARIFAAGSFFEWVPVGETYVLKSIIHDWDDQQSAAILSNCRTVMAKNGVLLVEAVAANGPRRNTALRVLEAVPNY